MVETESEQKDDDDHDNEFEAHDDERQHDDHQSAHPPNPDVTMPHGGDIPRQATQSVTSDSEDFVSNEHAQQTTPGVNSRELSIVPYKHRKFQIGTLDRLR